jgi:hypothetical protein
VWRGARRGSSRSGCWRCSSPGPSRCSSCNQGVICRCAAERGGGDGDEDEQKEAS